MFNKIGFKSVVAFGILAVVLTFLGVNFVPSILAESSAKENARIDARYAGSDWIERHPATSFNSSVWIERHPSVAAKPENYDNSDWFQRHPMNYSDLSGQIESRPSWYYDNSDYFKRHPEQTIP